MNQKNDIYINLKAGRVQGFYAEASPGSSTSLIKVLASDEQKIENPENLDFKFKQLGKVKISF